MEKIIRAVALPVQKQRMQDFWRWRTPYWRPPWCRRWLCGWRNILLNLAEWKHPVANKDSEGPRMFRPLCELRPNAEILINKWFMKLWNVWKTEAATKMYRAWVYQKYWNTLEFSPLYTEGNFVAPSVRQPQPRRQFQKICEYNFVELQVGQFSLSLERAQVDFVCRQILAESRINIDTWITIKLRFWAVVIVFHYVMKVMSDQFFFHIFLLIQFFTGSVCSFIK